MVEKVKMSAGSQRVMSASIYLSLPVPQNNWWILSQADNQTENVISCSIIHYNDPHTNNLQSGNEISRPNEFPGFLTETKLVSVFMERLSAIAEFLPAEQQLVSSSDLFGSDENFLDRSFTIENWHRRWTINFCGFFVQQNSQLPKQNQTTSSLLIKTFNKIGSKSETTPLLIRIFL